MDKQVREQITKASKAFKPFILDIRQIFKTEVLHDVRPDNVGNETLSDPSGDGDL